MGLPLLEREKDEVPNKLALRLAASAATACATADSAALALNVGLG